MTIFHEAPKSIFKDVQKLTSGDYFLVHLFEEDPEYLKLAEESVAIGRHTVLDNSIFELGEAFDMQKFADWVNRLKPEYYIVPDVLDDYLGTMKNMSHWCENYKDKIDPKCKMIGVVQGTTYEELVTCYKFMNKVADKIAFSFDSKYYEALVPHPNKLVSWMMGRVAFLSRMEKEGLINKNKPHHLLGTALPQEFSFYKKESWLDSVDTSNPVVCGMKRIMYDQTAGLREKPSEKLYTMINAELDDQQKSFIQYNIGVFKKFCNQNWY